ADAYRLITRNAAAGVEQQRRLLLADEARQCVSEAKAGVEAEPVKIGAEPRLGAGDAEIRHQREAEPAADRGALDRADDRRFGAEEAARLLVEMLAGAAAAAFVDRAGVHPLGEIGAGAERAALGAQHDRAAGCIVVEPLERFADLGDQVAVKEIMRWAA